MLPIPSMAADSNLSYWLQSTEDYNFLPASGLPIFSERSPRCLVIMSVGKLILIASWEAALRSPGSYCLMLFFLPLSVLSVCPPRFIRRTLL